MKFNVKKSKPSYSFSSIIFHSKTPSSQAEKFLFDNQRLILFQTYVIKNIAKIWVIRFLDFFYKHFHSSLQLLRSNEYNITRCNKGAFVRISSLEMKKKFLMDLSQPSGRSLIENEFLMPMLWAQSIEDPGRFCKIPVELKIFFILPILFKRFVCLCGTEVFLV